MRTKYLSNYLLVFGISLSLCIKRIKFNPKPKPILSPTHTLIHTLSAHKNTHNSIDLPRNSIVYSLTFKQNKADEYTIRVVESLKNGGINQL